MLKLHKEQIQETKLSKEPQEEANFDTDIANDIKKIISQYKKIKQKHKTLGVEIYQSKKN